MHLTIQPATPADWPAIWEIFREVISHGNTYTYAPDMSPEAAKDIWIRNGCHPYVARLDGRVVGTYTLRTNKPGLGDHVANAGYMVHKDFRGQGIAKAMCAHSLDEARKYGFQAMQFNFVVSTNAAAVDLWQKMGFKIIGTVPRAYRHARQGLTDVFIMHRFLNEEK
jgi:L-amino acid N-acyltransferase YncA